MSSLTRIDAISLQDHAHLTLEDECYFWKEYTSGHNYKFGETNQLISNLKKKPSRKSAELFHKDKAIAKCSEFFSSAITEDWIKSATLVPIPGSKAVGDADYDNRMLRVLRGIKPGLDVRELIIARSSIAPSHESAQGERATVSDLVNNYIIQDSLTSPTPKAIGIFDDVLSAGTHFRAMKQVLSSRFPGVGIVGFFVARRVFPSVDFSSAFD